MKTGDPIKIKSTKITHALGAVFGLLASGTSTLLAAVEYATPAPRGNCVGTLNDPESHTFSGFYRDCSPNGALECRCEDVSGTHNGNAYTYIQVKYRCSSSGSWNLDNQPAQTAAPGHQWEVESNGGCFITNAD